jgi:hypothetical protein
MNSMKKKLLVVLTIASFSSQLFSWHRGGYGYRGGWGYRDNGAAVAGGIIGGTALGLALGSRGSNESPESLDANRRRKSVERQIKSKHVEKRKHQQKYDKTGDQVHLDIIERIEKDIRRLEDQLANI